jgi:hypothetical protein
MTTALTLRPTESPSTWGRWRSRRAHDVVVSVPADIEFTWANRRPGTPGFARWTAVIGQRIDAHGLAATADDVDNLIGVARRKGVAPLAVDVLADPIESDPARRRAFAAVVAALVGAN